MLIFPQRNKQNATPLEIVSWQNGTDTQVKKMLDAAKAGKIDISQYWNIGDTRELKVGPDGGYHSIDYVKRTSSSSYYEPNVDWSGSYYDKKSCVNKYGFSFYMYVRLVHGFYNSKVTYAVQVVPYGAVTIQGAISNFMPADATTANRKTYFGGNSSVEWANRILIFKYSKVLEKAAYDILTDEQKQLFVPIPAERDGYAQHPHFYYRKKTSSGVKNYSQELTNYKYHFTLPYAYQLGLSGDTNTYPYFEPSAGYESPYIVPYSYFSNNSRRIMEWVGSTSSTIKKISYYTLDIGYNTSDTARRGNVTTSGTKATMASMNTSKGLPIFGYI